MIKRLFANCGIVLVAAWGLCGCSPSVPTGKIVPSVMARGVLLYRGEPLPFHQITVMPDDDRPAVGITREDGTFVLGTNRPADGAVSGTHPVAVRYVGPPSADPAEGMNVFTKPPAPSVKIDKKYQNASTSGLSVEIPPQGTSDLEIDLK
jgi:hypothetical protein